jgi:cation-transporting ATPase E
MTGDGVNDILALKGADCSIAMASGSSAARNVAHIVSLDNDFSKLPDVVAEGRRVINNLQRTATLFLTKTVFAF